MERDRDLKVSGMFRHDDWNFLPPACTQGGEWKSKTKTVLLPHGEAPHPAIMSQ